MGSMQQRYVGKRACYGGPLGLPRQIVWAVSQSVLRSSAAPHGDAPGKASLSWGAFGPGLGSLVENTCRQPTVWGNVGQSPHSPHSFHAPGPSVAPFPSAPPSPRTMDDTVAFSFLVSISGNRKMRNSAKPCHSSSRFMYW
ncbi:hypothetical protein EYF80_003350 [Liparis tanakae]|uniref:Uncharacterized protein n=1 Tax=Liparis tanakae TaxID=230148 RepID=A0A4Z2J8Z9_9TELE|nr:hypothetical protein EYF80_003350 [Liparis tanakae]